MREDERTMRKAHLEMMKTLSVQDKSTFASRMAATVGENAKARLPPHQPALPPDQQRSLAAAAMPGDR